MDINPYIKLMVEKNADCLYLGPHSAPRLHLNKQVKSVDNVLLSDNDLQIIFRSLTTDSQRLKFSSKKKLNFSAILLNNIDCTIEVNEQSSGFSILISPVIVKKDILEKVSTSLQDTQVLGIEPTVALDIFPYLAKLVELEASDLFITAGSPVKAKVHGEAMELDSFLLTPQLTKSAAYGIMNDEQIAEFEANKDLDFAISLHDNSARFRVNVFYQRHTIGLVLR